MWLGGGVVLERKCLSSCGVQMSSEGSAFKRIICETEADHKHFLLEILFLANELLRAWDLMQIEAPQSIEKEKKLKRLRNSQSSLCVRVMHIYCDYWKDANQHKKLFICSVSTLNQRVLKKLFECTLEYQ